jgi:hypothetical protein
MRFTKTQLSLVMALLLSNAIVLSGNFDWEWLRFGAALTLTFVLPGLAWLPALGWLHTRCPLERATLVLGGSSLLTALALFLALSLPGPFTEPSTLVALNLITLAGLLLQRLKPPSAIRHSPFTIHYSLFIILLIIAVAAFTRLVRIGYAEFHEDELENMRLIVRAYKGEEYASFLDSKGPIHWLLPAALWYLNGWLSEGVARTPFAITSLLLVPLIYALGRRMGSPHPSPLPLGEGTGGAHPSPLGDRRKGAGGAGTGVGLLAACFVALNGFFVAYARHVENQSLIVFWGALAMWLAYRYYTEEGRGHFLLYIALALAIGLIAHPDVLLYLPVFAYVVGLKLRPTWPSQWPWAAGAVAIFVGLVALFYVPYLTDPQIGQVYQYFADERIGRSLLYNRVENLFDQDKLYSTRYHAPVLVALLAWLLGRNFARLGRRGWLIFGGVALAIVTTVLWPEGWIVAEVNLAFAPYALLTLLVLWLPAASFELKLLYLWLSLPLGALLFLAQDAADHIQIAYPAWALLAALGLADLWAFLSQWGQLPRLALRAALGAGLAVVAGLILTYQYLAFDAPITTYWQAKIEAESSPDSLYAQLYGSLPRPRKIFSNPRLGGWKVPGYLWETGQMVGDFRSVNESFAVPIWYTFQTARSCYEDPRHYWVQRDWQGWPEEEPGVVAQGYTLTRIVLVDGQPKLHLYEKLYEKNAPPRIPEILDLEEYRHKFDRMATPARFAQEESPTYPASFNFGDKLLLRGYDLPQAVVHPGDLLPVTVYWESLAPMEIRYRGFVHLVDTNGTRWGQHDDDPACRLLTTDMRPGQRSARQFRLPVAPDSPPGDYQIIFGLYHPDTFERLPIWDNLTGQPAGDHLILGQVQIIAAP